MIQRERRGERRDDRKRRRNRAHAEAADQTLPELRGVLLEAGRVGEDEAGPVEHPLALRREPLESLAPPDDQEAELLLELLDAVGQGRLRHAARLGGAGEVALARDGHQVVQMPQEHGCPGYRLSAARVLSPRSSGGRLPPPRNSQWAGSHTRPPGRSPRRSAERMSCSASSHAGTHSPATTPGYRRGELRLEPGLPLRARWICCTSAYVTSWPVAR